MKEQTGIYVTRRLERHAVYTPKDLSELNRKGRTLVITPLEKPTVLYLLDVDIMTVGGITHIVSETPFDTPVTSQELSSVDIVSMAKTIGFSTSESNHAEPTISFSDLYGKYLKLPKREIDKPAMSQWIDSNNPYIHSAFTIARKYGLYEVGEHHLLTALKMGPSDELFDSLCTFYEEYLTYIKGANTPDVEQEIRKNLANAYIQKGLWTGTRSAHETLRVRSHIKNISEYGTLPVDNKQNSGV